METQRIPAVAGGPRSRIRPAGAGVGVRREATLVGPDPGERHQRWAAPGRVDRQGREVPRRHRAHDALMVAATAAAVDGVGSGLHGKLRDAGAHQVREDRQPGGL
ncbi:MAG: hypothetical protein DIU76_10640, partial [Bacillota bacterium]